MLAIDEESWDVEDIAKDDVTSLLFNSVPESVHEAVQRLERALRLLTKPTECAVSRVTDGKRKCILNRGPKRNQLLPSITVWANHAWAFQTTRVMEMSPSSASCSVIATLARILRKVAKRVLGTSTWPFYVVLVHVLVLTLDSVLLPASFTQQMRSEIFKMRTQISMMLGTNYQHHLVTPSRFTTSLLASTGKSEPIKESHKNTKSRFTTLCSPSPSAFC